MDARAAQRLANEKGLDLVKVAPNAKPPVCKIMDFGKYKFELAKKEKENSQTGSKVPEVGRQGSCQGTFQRP